ncbi:MAG: alpha/beta fold hydrolase, partial [Candidatus Woesearchaeota archaeon]
FSFKNYSLPDFNNSPNIKDMNFPEKKCCFYKKCKKCSEYDKYPLILIHGHSFNQKNSAYQSTEIFNFLEEKLTNEYISLGIEDFYTARNKIMFDILTKPTYYINKKDIFGNEIIESKDETIEEYADRLKDIIDNTKKTSEKDKVNIVAHSMGGLVVRRYIQKYGHENIDNLILIATPNQGIIEKIYNLCIVFGNKNECLDMKKDSDFIKKINTQYDMPKTFLIIGRGCNLDGEDSDGIVTISNAKLGDEFTYKTYYIEGECTTTKLLHNEILYKEKTADIIKNILK